MQRPKVSVAGKPRGKRTALGFRAHTGWAVVVAIAGPPRAPSVVYRSRIELGSTDAPRFVYHAAQEAGPAKAPGIVRRAETTAHKAAADGIRAALATLESQGHQAVAGTVLVGTARVPAALETILASHPLIHAAEGKLFRDALISGCKACGIHVNGIPERELWNQAEKGLGLKKKALENHLAELGRVSGRPWAQDQKLAAMAAWLALLPGSESNPVQ